MHRPRIPPCAARTLAVVVLLLAPLVPSPLAVGSQPAPTEGWPTAEGWPVYGGSTAHQGYAPAIGPAKKTEAAAPYTLMARSFSAPVLDDQGHIYVGDNSGKVYKLTSGLDLVWTSKGLGGPLRASVLVGPDGTVYAAPVHDKLFALDGTTGKVRWEAAIGNTAPADEYVVTGAPVWHPDGFVLAPSMDGHLYAVGPDGKQRWKHQAHTDLDNKVVSSPAVREDGRIYVGSQNGRLYAVAPDGQRAWAIETRAQTGIGCREEQIVAAPSIGPDGTVYIGTRLKSCGNVGAVYAIEDAGDRGKRKWVHQMGDKVTAPVAVGPSGDLYVGSLDGAFERIDPADGSTKWSFDPRRDDPTLDDEIPFSVTDPIAFSVAEQAAVDAAGRVYVSYWHIDFSQGFPPQESLESPFYALDAKNGDIVWRKVFPKTVRAPALMPTIHTQGDDRHAILYAAGDDAKVYALGTVGTEPHTLGTPDPSPSPTPTPPEPEPTPSGPGTGTPAPSPGDDNETGQTPALPLVPSLALLVACVVWAARTRPMRKP